MKSERKRGRLRTNNGHAMHNACVRLEFSPPDGSVVKSTPYSCRSRLGRRVPIAIIEIPFARGVAPGAVRNKCLFVSSTNRLFGVCSWRNFNLGDDKGINFVRDRDAYYSGSSVSYVTQQWHSSYSGNDYENASRSRSAGDAA